MTSILFRSTIVLLSALVLQASLFTQLQLADTRADVMLVLALGAGLAAGPDRGAIVGFCAGLLVDLLTQSPFGLSALTYLLVGYVAGAVTSLNLVETRWFAPAVGLLGGAAGVVLFSLLGELLGQSTLQTPDLVRITVVVAVTSGLLVVPARRVMTWALARPNEDPLVVVR